MTIPWSQQKTVGYIIAALAGALVYFAPATVGAQPDPSPEPTAKATGSPLAKLPSPRGQHLKKIAALGSDQWLELGPPAPDATWGVARGRSWASKMAYSSDLRAAFLAGEGVHGWWNEKTRRYMDDVWAYDINAHRWICVYPGADTKTLDLKLNADGFESTADGQPIPVAQMGHAYEMTAFDPDSGQFAFMPCPADYWHKALGERRAGWLPKGADTSGQSEQRAPGPWLLDVKTNRWQRTRTSGPGPRSSFGDVLIYLPKRGRYFYRDNHKDVWYYEIAASRWTKIAPKGPAPPFGIDPTACYDARRERIYIGGGEYPNAPGPNALWIYDLKTDAWIDPQPGNKPAQGSNDYGTNEAVMTYDTANDVVVLMYFLSEPAGAAGIWIYDPSENRWSDRHPFPADLRWKQVNGFYDPELNAHYYHSAGDSEADGTVWVYRYQNRPQAR